MAEGWMLDELAHAGPEHLDPEFVAGYDRKQAFDPSGDVDVLRNAGIGAGSSIVDLAAGTGKLTVAAAPMVGHVTAVDVSPAMVSLLRARVAAEALTNVDRSEHSTFRWLFEPLLVAAGFEIADVDYRSSIYASYSCVKRSS